MKASIPFVLVFAIFSTGMVEAKQGGRRKFVRGDKPKQRRLLDVQQGGRRKFVRGDKPKQRRLVDVQIFGSDPIHEYPLARCQGDCDVDTHCEAELVCYQRNARDPVPGCSGGTRSSSRTDYCVDPNDIPSGPTPPVASPTSSPVTPEGPQPQLKNYGESPPASKFPLGECEGDCDSDSDCEQGLECFQRGNFGSIPGCSGSDSSRTDYCVRPDQQPSPIDPPNPSPINPPNPSPTGPTPSPLTPTSPPVIPVGSQPPIQNYGGSPPASKFPLRECEGDCDSDSDCEQGLVCFQRSNYGPVPGCSGSDYSHSDFCVKPDDGPSQPPPTNPPHPSLTSPPNPSPINPPNPSPTLSTTSFRLKLYWEEGYDWQEEFFEREWCMKCRNSGCNLGNKIYIYECSDISERFDFVNVNNDQVLIKLDGTDTCLERDSKEIFIKACDDGNSNQKWFAKVGEFDQDRFEISLKTYDRYCITQRHHPKRDEEVLLEKCTQARDGLTSFWNRY
jgi:hypothetical protein